VVLVGEHTDDGALGVVLNRPTPVVVGEAVPSLGDLAGPDERVFFGGPVQPEAAVVVAELESGRRPDVMVFDSIGFLTGEVAPETAAGVRRARVFAGYAGWGPGQLEQELQESSWIVEPALAGDVFTADPEGLWSAVLRRKGGTEYRLLSLMPMDPSEN
jgi:putative transcriptional regulator